MQIGDTVIVLAGGLIWWSGPEAEAAEAGESAARLGHTVRNTYVHTALEEVIRDAQIEAVRACTGSWKAKKKASRKAGEEVRRRFAEAARGPNIVVVERVDRMNRTYFTPVVPTPSGDGTMAAELVTPRGAIVGPRYTTRAIANRAVAYHLANLAEQAA